MTVEIFSKEQFENALPNPHWVYAGLKQNEYTYFIPITDDIKIEIRSSVGISGYSAESGQDSIRVWLTNGEGKPLGSKVSKWITRRSGWESRLLYTLRALWAMAQKAGYCQSCNVPNGVFKVKKSGPNKGRVFSKCPQENCKVHKNGWQWLT